MSIRDRISSWRTGQLPPLVDLVEIANQLAAASRRIDDLTHERDLLREVSAECLRREAQAVRDRDDLLDLRAINDVVGLMNERDTDG